MRSRRMARISSSRVRWGVLAAGASTDAGTCSWMHACRRRGRRCQWTGLRFRSGEELVAFLLGRCSVFFSGAGLPTAGLEQQRLGRVPGFLVGVVAGHQRDGAGAAADPGDDRAEDIGELRADQQQSFYAGLGRRDLQQRDELAGGGQPVLGDAVVAELAEFFEPDAVSGGLTNARPRRLRFPGVSGRRAARHPDRRQGPGPAPTHAAVPCLPRQ